MLGADKTRTWWIPIQKKGVSQTLSLLLIKIPKDPLLLNLHDLPTVKVTLG